VVDYAYLNQMLYMGKGAEVKALTEAAVAEGAPVHEIMEHGLMAGMAVVGEDFKNMTLYVPEVLCAARAMKAGMGVLRPILTAHTEDYAGTLVIGTVEGDLHDLGKNLVAMMAEGAGFKVIDLGMDTSYARFLAAAEAHEADVVGLSALLTTTMPQMKGIIGAFRQSRLRQVKLICGGAPVTQSFAEEIGADGYAANAATAVELLRALVERKGERIRG
jgi:5-methyltetrahydrofolate--homocysteine methyltransferase